MMGRLWETASERGHVAAVALHAFGGHAADLRTLRRYLLDPVLPVLTLLLMSVLTVVMIVVIVGAVADMGQLFQDDAASEVLQPGWCLTQAVWHDEDVYPGYMAFMNGREEPWLQADSQAQSESPYTYSMSE